MRVLRISHSAVVSAWRERERVLRARGVELQLSRRAEWVEGGAPGPIRTRRRRLRDRRPDLGQSSESVRVCPAADLAGARCGDWDVLDIHEEPCSLAAAEILMLRALRRLRDAVHALFGAEHRQALPAAVSLDRDAGRCGTPRGVSVCNSEAGAILRRKGLRGDGRRDSARGRPDVFERTSASGAKLDRLGSATSVGSPTTRACTCCSRRWSQLPEATLVLVGSGPAEAALARQRASGSGWPTGRVSRSRRHRRSGRPLSQLRRARGSVVADARPGWSNSAGSSSRRWRPACR